ncbi:hypothetical protein LZ32DRAFT_600681 [Colletotrichum eremochloae]|uniref:Uncharacterized protein n=1 Tax=Colletotrichum sublineola TaxID=1173701 RepID=A0A066XLE6_COLSU|nr:hypothetical protein LY78DRAFT_749342 [Colletotrichum sublineola]KAK2017484.1 hypothetical protein LZ32DRAFT_600681 [Colletotrichum eremochloae]KDN70028.1 hypothetical protein CSUB01_08475 [Colletotrichum sublineola]
MKAPARRLLLLGYTAAVYVAAAPGQGDTRAAIICGDLGVLNIDVSQLPEGVSPSDLRMCAGHPNGRVRILDPQQGVSLVP